MRLMTFAGLAKIAKKGTNRTGLADGQNPAPPWHALSAAAALQKQESSPEGLTDSEAARRRAVFGSNVLPQSRAHGPLRRFLAQFDNVLIHVLLGSAIITAMLGEAVDTAVILGVVLINAVIGFLQEGRAEKALDAIRDMVSPRATVLREGHRVGIAAAELVPGDILVLEAGDRVTADVRVLHARNLRIDEAILTGESEPATKSPAPSPADAMLGDRHSMAYSGTFVTAGHGRGLVVATGSRTELGRISALLGGVEQLTTPLVRRMNEFSRHLTVAILALAAAALLFAVLARGYSLADAFMTAVAMAVAAIPEGLPAVMTITLAIGVQRMAARNAIIRRLPVVETLGSVSIICSDKTGTLTRNEMTVRGIVTAAAAYRTDGVGYAPHGGFYLDGVEIDPAAGPGLAAVTRAVLLCSNATLRKAGGHWVVEGDPMEGALVSLALKAGHEPERARRELARIDEIPFDAGHRFMATLHQSAHDGAVIYLKGAPEKVLAMCAREAGPGGIEPINREFWHGEVEALASHGQRVLAVAMKHVPGSVRALTPAAMDHDFVLLGLLGLIDPPREEAVAAIGECRAAGIGVKMITGDHAVTAEAIARQLGLENPGAVMTGHDIDALDSADLRERALGTSVFARTSPEHKLRLVEALQSDGRVVAMTGDGVNDAPALKRADVGVAMGRKGTETAKEAADMVLADDNFASIVAAVGEGRTVYDNITKVIGWTLPTNLGEALIIVPALLLGSTLPITPVQILWINMVTAVGLGLVLAFEPAEPDVMRRPPRPSDEPLLPALLVWRIIFVSVLFALFSFAVFGWAGRQGLTIEESRTLVVNTIVVMEISYLFNVRYSRMTSLTLEGVVGTPAVLIGVGSVVLLQGLLTFAPFMHWMFHTRAIPLGGAALIVAAGVAFFAILETEKLFWRTFKRSGNPPEKPW